MNNIIKRVWNQNRMVIIEDLCGMAFQAESGGHTFAISGVDDTGAVVPLSGTVAGVFRRPDNADIALTGAASGGVASVTLTDDCYAVPGRFWLTIYTTSDGQKTAVYAAVGTVAATNGGAVAGDTPQDVVDLINAIEAAVATIPADYTDLMAAIAPTYSPSGLYPVGFYVWHDGNLHKCIVPITTAETWTAAHWTAAVLGDDVSNIKNALKKNGGAYEKIEYPLKDRAITTSQAVGSTVSLTPYEALGYYLATIECSEGDVFQITGDGGYSPRLWAFIDADNKMLANADSLVSVTDLVIIAPENAAKLILNNQNPNDTYKGASLGKRINNLETIAQNTAYLERGDIAGAVDFNTLTENGAYFASYPNNYINYPFECAAWLYVSKAASLVQQILIPYFFSSLSDSLKQVILRRNYNGSAWSEWEPFASNSLYGYYYAFGDSLTYGSVNSTQVRPDMPYPTMVGKVCGLATLNNGLGGQGFLNTQWYPTTALSTVQNTDISLAKLITLAWGTNDTVSSPLGTPSDASGANTVCGQMKAILDSIISRNHLCQIVIIGMPRSSVGFDVAGAAGWSRDDFETAMKAIGVSYCVPFVSYHECSLCNETNWLANTSESDRVHPSNAGYNIISAYIAGQVQKYFSAK